MIPEPDVYRVQPRGHWWRRTWQAEWETPAHTWCPRAWTERGIYRKALRWQLRGQPRWVLSRGWRNLRAALVREQETGQ